MGNAAPRAQPPQHVDSASQYRTYLLDYSPRGLNMMFLSLIGDGKFLKSIQCRCEEGQLVVKIYRKFDPQESLSGAETPLRKLQFAFTLEKQPNVLPYADYALSAKHHVAFLVRQYFTHNLYDRVCSRPFLTTVEKKWIAYQLLRALDQIHSKRIYHGDIKMENVMVTSWNWLFITDFAPFKPTYIPEDDPADYNYYFCAIDATRRGCSVAPERFYGRSSARAAIAAANNPTGSTKGADAMMLSRMADSEVSVEEVEKQFLALGMANPNGVPPTQSASSNKKPGDTHLNPAMDIFSAGCVIAEVFNGGKPLFDLPSLLKYRTGDTDSLNFNLQKIATGEMKELLLHMLQLNPNGRMSASEYLQKYTGSEPDALFPSYFDSFLFRFLMLVLSPGGKVPDARVRLICKYYGRIVKEVAGVEDKEGVEFFKQRLKEGYGSDRQLNQELNAGEGDDVHVAQRVLDEVQDHPSRPQKDKKLAEESPWPPNHPMAKLQKLKEKESDMNGISGTLQKKKIEQLHDQYNSLTQRKKQSLMLDYDRENTSSESPAPPQARKEEKRTKKPRHEPSNVNASRKDRLRAWDEDRNGIVIILSLLCSTLRHVQVPEMKLTALYLVQSLAQFTSDEVRLQRLVPFLVEILDDPSARVRSLSIRTLTFVLSLIESFPLADASVFPKYILPALTPFPYDPDEMVRITFAESIAKIASTSRRFLEIAHAMKQKYLGSSTTMTNASTRSGDLPLMLTIGSNNFDDELSLLHQKLARFVIQLSSPDQKTSSALVKRALLLDITRLCTFFGRERTLDVVLPQLITFLNDADWELRGAFFDYITGVCSFVGRNTVELYVLPCIEQALFDAQEIVVTKAVECLAGLCHLGLFDRRVPALTEKARMAAPLLLHPSWWVRDAVIRLLADIAGRLGRVDANVFLVPALRPYMLHQMVFLLDEDEEQVRMRLSMCCRPYLTRATFDKALQQGATSTIDDLEHDNLDNVDDGSRRSDGTSSSVANDKKMFGHSKAPSSTTVHEPPGGRDAESRKHQVAALKLLSQYVDMASVHMQTKMELAQAERSQSRRTVDKSATASAISVTSPRAGSGHNLLSRKVTRSHLHVLYVPDMRYALSVAMPLKSVNLQAPTASASSSSSSTVPSNALVTRSATAHGRMQRTSSATTLATVHSQKEMTGSSNSTTLVEHLSLPQIIKAYGLVGPNLPFSSTMPSKSQGTTSVSFTGTSGNAEESAHDNMHFAPASGGVMVSMLNMNIRDGYDGDMLSPSSSTSSSSRNPRQAKRANTSSEHYFSFKEFATDPALQNPRKLLARLTALGIPPLPPDLGSLRLPDGNVFSIYSHPSNPHNTFASHNPTGLQADRGGHSTPTASPIAGGLFYGGLYSSFGGVVPSPSSTSSQNGEGFTQAATSGGNMSYWSRSWRPRKNILVAELSEHEGAVNRVDASQDYSFLASASSDGTVKLWSVKSLQHSVNQGSRCTYDGQGGVLTDMKVLDNSHSVAVASSNGSIHVFRVDKVNAVGGNFHATGLKELRSEASAVMALDYLNNVSESLLIYATRSGELRAWDLRMRRQAWCLHVSQELGYVTSMTHSLDVSWLAAGTSRGFILLWDLRFLVLIRIWRHSSHRCIHSIQPCLGLPNTKQLEETSVPLVYVAAGDSEVAVFDLSIGACRAVFRTLHVQATEAEATRCPTLSHVPIPHRTRHVMRSYLGIYGIASAFDEISTTPLGDEPTVRTMLCPSLHLKGLADALITGGEDKQLRFWDIHNGKKSYTVCGDARSHYDVQSAPHDWWRINSQQPASLDKSDQASAAISKPEMTWSKLSPPIVTTCQDSSYYSSQAGPGSVVNAGGGVENAVTMEKQGLVAPSPAHNDCILDLALVDLHGPMLVSSGRDGLIKVWK